MSGRVYRDAVDWQRLFDEVEWLLDGNVPAGEVARRVGYGNTDSLLKAYWRHERPLPPALVRENAHNKMVKSARRRVVR